MRVGLLTGGGDCPGLNAAIRAVVKHGENSGHQIIGFRNGFRGVVDGDLMPLSRSQIRNVLPLGGTLLGTARFHPREEDGTLAAVQATLAAERIEALICIGGDGTLGVAAARVSEAGVRVVGIPKTIDNDVWGTDRSIGYDTAVSIATEALDRVHTTAESHNRVMVVEVMGRHSGWIAINAGIAGGAEIVLVPEDPFDIDEVVRFLKHRHRAHASFSIVVVAEGAEPKAGTSMDYTTQLGKFGEIVAGAVSERLAREIQERTGFDTRVTVLGHVQRGGTPIPSDRILGSRFGVAAMDAVNAGKTGVMTALRGEEIVLVPIADVAGKTKDVPPDLIRAAGLLA